MKVLQEKVNNQRYYAKNTNHRIVNQYHSIKPISNRGPKTGNNDDKYKSFFLNPWIGWKVFRKNPKTNIFLRIIQRPGFEHKTTSLNLSAPRPITLVPMIMCWRTILVLINWIGWKVQNKNPTINASLKKIPIPGIDPKTTASILTLGPVLVGFKPCLLDIMWGMLHRYSNSERGG